MADISVKESAPKWKFPFKIKIENRVDNPPTLVISSIIISPQWSLPC